MAGGRLVIVTGIMAAGKSTIAQALAERFPASAHVRGDHFRRSIVRGRHEMSPQPDDMALEQLRLRYRMALWSAEQYRRAGFTTVLQDTIIGPMLTEFVAMIDDRPFSLVVLAPEPGEVARREQQRGKKGYGSFSPEQLDAILRAETPRLGYWLDSTNLSIDETVDHIVANLDGDAMVS
jgi:predicted kinase